MLKNDSILALVYLLYTKENKKLTLLFDFLLIHEYFGLMIYQSV